MSSAKEQILERIRQANTGTSSIGYHEIPRFYRQSGALTVEERVALFTGRLGDYGAVVSRCREAELPGSVRERMRAAGMHRLLIAPELPRALQVGEELCRVDQELSYAELDLSEGVLTTCALAIAETGTIVLAHTAAAGRRALTLIPDYHLCVVREDQIAESVPEGINWMARLGSLPLTTISGPSATSDIEMIRVKGVHGPRQLDVVVVRPNPVLPDTP